MSLFLDITPPRGTVQCGILRHGSDVTARSVPRCCAGDAVATQNRRFGLLCAMSRYRPKPDEHSEKPGT
jgi:hypothetical protein